MQIYIEIHILIFKFLGRYMSVICTRQSNMDGWVHNYLHSVSKSLLILKGALNSWSVRVKMLWGSMGPIAVRGKIRNRWTIHKKLTFESLYSWCLWSTKESSSMPFLLTAGGSKGKSDSLADITKGRQETKVWVILCQLTARAPQSIRHLRLTYPEK